MKRSLCILLLLAFGLLNAQSDLPVAANVSVTIAGLTDNNTIAKSKLTGAKQLALSGPDAGKYKIVSYVAVYTGVDGLTEEEMDGPEFSIDMNNFFQIMEKNSRLQFKDVVLKGSDKKKYKAPELHLIVHFSE